MKTKKPFNYGQFLFTFSWFESKSLLKCILSNFQHLLLFIFVSLIVFEPSIVYANTCEQWVAQVVSAQGAVEAKRTGETGWLQVQPDDTFCAGDMIRVLEESRADLAFSNQPLLRLDQNSAITLGGIEVEEAGLAGLFKGATKIDLLKGAAHFFSRLPRNLEVRTGFVNAGVEGTEFFIGLQKTRLSYPFLKEKSWQPTNPEIFR